MTMKSGLDPAWRRRSQSWDMDARGSPWAVRVELMRILVAHHSPIQIGRISPCGRLHGDLMRFLSFTLLFLCHYLSESSIRNHVLTVPSPLPWLPLAGPMDAII